MELRAGTSGFAYEAWRGSFYPEGLPAKSMLEHYAAALLAVEINNTFYRLPSASVLEGWAARVPEGFRFALKASRRITHHKRLRDAGDETGYLLRTAASLGPKLGALLFQLPPNLGLDPERLDRFLELLPAGTRAAFEFRHPAWADAAVFERLRARDLAWVTVDGEDAPVEACGPATASWGYLRLRRAGYERAELAAWAARVAAQPWGEAFVFFKHEDAGAAPRLAAELLALASRAGERRPAKAAGDAPAQAKPRRVAPSRRRSAV
jgi:uncharacterized protein YecE (DUF72 family)